MGASLNKPPKSFIDFANKNSGKVRRKGGDLQFICRNGHKWIAPDSIPQKGGWCRFCSGSKGEQKIMKYLDSKKIPYVYDSLVPGFGAFRPDFVFEYKKRNYVVEFDGIQHFKHTPYFHRTVAEFERGQQRDKEKQNLALELGYIVIRIDYSEEKNIDSHLKKAMKLKKTTYYVSRPDLYRYLH